MMHRSRSCPALRGLSSSSYCHLHSRKTMTTCHLSNTCSRSCPDLRGYLASSHCHLESSKTIATCRPSNTRSRSTPVLLAVPSPSPRNPKNLLMKDSSCSPPRARSEATLIESEEAYFHFSDLPSTRWGLYRENGNTLKAIELREEGDRLHSEDPDFLRNVTILEEEVVSARIIRYKEKEVPGVCCVYSAGHPFYIPPTSLPLVERPARTRHLLCHLQPHTGRRA